MDERFKNVTGGQIEWNDDGSTVIKLDVKSDKPAETFAPTAIFRWAKSSPSAPPVLQQKWIRTYDDLVYRKQPQWEWRDVETVILGDEPAAPRICPRCERDVNVTVCDNREDCPDIEAEPMARPVNLGPKCPSCGLRLDEAKDRGCLVSACAYYVRR